MVVVVGIGLALMVTSVPPVDNSEIEGLSPEEALDLIMDLLAERQQLVDAIKSLSAKTVEQGLTPEEEQLLQSLRRQLIDNAMFLQEAKKQILLADQEFDANTLINRLQEEIDRTLAAAQVASATGDPALAEQIELDMKILTDLLNYLKGYVAKVRSRDYQANLLLA